MAGKFTDTLHQIMVDTSTLYKSNLAQKGINASKRTTRGIRVQEYGRGWRIAWTDGAPAETTEIGREGGAVPKGFRFILEQWTRDKGLTFESESKRRSFSYLLAQRIAREGTLRHKQPVDIYTRATDLAVEKIKKAWREQTFGGLRQIFRIKENAQNVLPFAETIKVLKKTPTHRNL